MADIANADFLRQFANNRNGRDHLVDGVILPLEKPLIGAQLEALEERRGAFVKERASTPLTGLGTNDLALNGISKGRVRLEELLHRRVVGYPDPDENRVTLGSLVRIMQGTTESALAIVGYSGVHSGFAEGISPASIAAPLVKQLIGYQAGQTVPVEFNGAPKEVAIIAIDQLAIQQRDPNLAASL